MNSGKRITGGIFCLSAAILFAARSVVDAIYQTSLTPSSATGSGTTLLILSLICLAVGLWYLYRAGRETIRALPGHIKKRWRALSENPPED